MGRLGNIHAQTTIEVQSETDDGAYEMSSMHPPDMARSLTSNIEISIRGPSIDEEFQEGGRQEDRMEWEL